MLELKKITKIYPAGGENVEALKEVDLQFRENEFVAILGPSGCGKTTMLNIIGGLDQYTSGDLVINGKSTKEFKDHDWDTYRNQSVGFVFQSYNLIPHQTVLQNVELALTLSGVSKEERRKRATKALQDVGLGNQLKKLPSEMSGGQMQRVAIARALVNDPDIILADEPTGALDSTTSVQVMEILRKVSGSKLIIMVTHNSDLADRYATRIIRVLDGQLIGDSNPVTEAEYKVASGQNRSRADKEKEKKRPSMSFFTALSLSLKNLMTKKGRTLLTAFAGSIGIIGIALILALSQGFTTYIDDVQENALSSYPLTIESSVTDVGSLMETLMGASTREITHDLNGVYSNPITYDLVNALGDMETTENDLKAFKAYLETERANPDSASGLHEAVSGIQYTYNLSPSIYTKDPSGGIIKSDSMELLKGLVSESMGMDIGSMGMGGLSAMEGSGSMMSMFSGSSFSMNVWQEMLPGDDGKLHSDLLDKQYDVIYGSWPNSYDEIVLVVDENNELDDLSLYALGLVPTEDMTQILKAAMSGETLTSESKRWSFAELSKMEFRVVLDSSRYSYDEATGTCLDLTATDAGMNYLYDSGITLKISGIIRPNEKADVTMLSGSIGYTSALTDYIVEKNNTSATVTAQMDDPTTDIFTGLPFKTGDAELTDAEKAEALTAHIAALTPQEKASLYIDIMSIPTDEYVQGAIAQYMQGVTREELETTMIGSYAEQTGMDMATIQAYIADMDDETLYGYLQAAMAQQIRQQYAEGVAQQAASANAEQLSAALDAAMPQYGTEQLAAYYDTFMPATYSDSTYDANLRQLGYVDLDTPSSINIYASTFAAKDVITDAITAYNSTVEDTERIAYTDFIGIMMSSITAIINAITYVLIAFVAISLIVSSIMIGVITLISVQERTKEIGILRAIGASKGDVSSVFNAETMIVGFSAGLLGVLVTYLLCIPINIIIRALTGIPALGAILPWQAAAILVVISVVLTLISGIIPSRSAAKKDPVVALRTE